MDSTTPIRREMLHFRGSKIADQKTSSLSYPEHPPTQCMASRSACRPLMERLGFASSTTLATGRTSTFGPGKKDHTSSSKATNPWQTRFGGYSDAGSVHMARAAAPQGTR